MTIFTDTLKKFIAPSELMPAYGKHVTPRIVTMDKERLFAVVMFQGIPFETTPDEQLTRAFDSLTKIFSELNKLEAPNLAQWQHIIKRNVTLEFDYNFTNPFVSSFAQKYLGQFKSGKFFQTHYAISFVYKHDDDIDKGIERLDQVLDFVLNAMNIYDPVVMGVKINEHGVPMSEVGEFLSELVNGTKDSVPLSTHRQVDTVQTGSLHFGHDLLEARPAAGGKRYGTYYDLKEYPDDSYRGMWNFLLEVPYEFILTQSFLHFTANATLRLIDKQINKLESGTHSPGHHVEELKAAKNFVSAGSLCFGEYHGALVVFGNTPKEATDNGTELMSRFVAGSGARFVRSTTAGIFTYFSQMPGAKDKPLSEPKTTRNLACGFSLNNNPIGKPHGNPIGDGSAVIPFKTRFDGIFFFNCHYSHAAQNNVGEKVAGHVLMLGVTGAGKTTTEGVLVGFLTRFNPKLFAIDFNKSMQMFLETYGAEYFDIEDGVETGLNPFQLEDSPKLRTFLYMLLAACARPADGSEVTAEDEGKIKSCVDIIMGMPFEHRCFSHVSSLIPLEGGNSLGNRLAKWQRSQNGSLAWALDAPVNRFDPKSMDKVGFNTTDILVEGHPATEAILSVLFHMKEMMQVDGRLFLTLIEEFWVPCNYPTTQKQIKGILKAGRIKGEFCFLVSQSPKDAIACEIFDAIIEQTPTKIFLPNPEGKLDQYKLCGLNEKEYRELVALEKDSRTFLVKQSQQSVFCKLDLYGYDDFLPIISGTWENIQLAHEIQKNIGSKDPAVWVPEFQATLRAIKEARK